MDVQLPGIDRSSSIKASTRSLELFDCFAIFKTFNTIEIMESVLVDTVASLQSFLESLPLSSGKRPDLYVDLEGDDLCRQGTLSLVTIHVESKNTVHLLDV